MFNRRVAFSIILMHVSGLILWGQDAPVPQPAALQSGTYSESSLFVPKDQTPPKRSKKPKKAKDADPKIAEDTDKDSEPELSPSPIPEATTLAVPVSVYDASAKAVRGLTKDDFEVYLDDQRQEIVGFRGDDEPLYVVFLIDISPSTQFTIADIQKFFIASLKTLRLDDKVAVIRFDEHIKLGQDFTTDRLASIKAIEQLEFGDGTSLYEAVGTVSKLSLDFLNKPVSVVLFTDGVDTTSRKVGFARSLLRAQQSNMTFYPLYVDSSKQMYGKIPGGSKTMDDILAAIMSQSRGHVIGRRSLKHDSQAEYDLGRAYLADLTNATGGREFQFPKEASDIDLSQVMRQRYSLLINISNPTRASKMHHIKVRVTKPKLSVIPKRTFAIGD
jgi:VWFA-related protein